MVLELVLEVKSLALALTFGVKSIGLVRLTHTLRHLQASLNKLLGSTQPPTLSGTGNDRAVAYGLYVGRKPECG